MERAKLFIEPNLIQGIDELSSQILENLGDSCDMSNQEAALFYIRRSPGSGSDIIERFSDGGGRAECELMFRSPEGGASAWVKTKLKRLATSPDSYLFAAEFENITTRKSLEVLRENEAMRRALDAAHRDFSTGVYNKYFTEDIIRGKLAAADEGYNLLLILDIDLLKNINDTYGHPVGDQVLRNVAGILRGQFRKDDIVGRVGGDEFMVLAGGIDGEEEARRIVERLLEKIGEVKVCEFNLSVSVGCVLAEPGGEDFDTLYRNADKALYHVKRNGRNGCDFYSAEND